ncbi:HEPN domain-containing protein [Synechococcus sp. RSCCF101]|uniref:HEPN domain-containing protein n=1 Tax=Synechococcus sp. RSCCF101 TaxID=2511069 RepID=UPI001247CD1D|nr:HEPN domain-containing protein [Synechococcus sp. RSCCF101]QEY32358.1 HEPN domain-containing protein [Synechococcus sp. RSCCF101]
MNARPEAWLRQAENDLALAELAKAHGFLAQACFFASQAAEKALKGALLELGLEPPHTHVLGDLVHRLQDAGLDVTPFAALPLQRLSRMAISSRYPQESTPPSELFDLDETREAIGTARSVITIVSDADAGS